MIYLVDLNYTLVINSLLKSSNFLRQIEREQYSMELIDRLRNEHALLITARPDKYYEKTLESLLEKTGWQPQEAYFNSGKARPPEAKKAMLLEQIFPRHGSAPQNYTAIESNPATRSMYAKFGILAMMRDDFLGKSEADPEPLSES